MASLSGQTMVLIITLVLLFAIAIAISDEDALRKRRYIKITNDLWSGVDMKLHCKSGDNDLGEHILPHGGIYEFNFRPRTFPANTLFYCTFQFQSVSHTYDVYTEKVKCSQCWYSVKDFGEICRYNWDTKKYDKCSPSWNSSEIDPPTPPY